MNKIAVAILLGSFIIAVAILFNGVTQSITNQTVPPQDAEKIYQNISFIKTIGSPYLGNQTAPVTVIEYIDFECPICKRVYDEIFPKLKNEYINNNKVKFVFKSLPIENLHKTTYIKTEAAFCASGQGGNNAFFAYHDELFNRFGPIWGSSIEDELTAIARQLKLDPAEFQECMSKQTFKPVIEKDKVEAVTINANGTPTWLIGKTGPNGSITDTIKINGLHEYGVYKAIIDHLLTNE